MEITGCSNNSFMQHWQLCQPALNNDRPLILCLTKIMQMHITELINLKKFFKTLFLEYFTHQEQPHPANILNVSRDFILWLYAAALVQDSLFI
jgi:hypothetical protein